MAIKCKSAAAHEQSDRERDRQTGRQRLCAFLTSSSIGVEPDTGPSALIGLQTSCWAVDDHGRTLLQAEASEAARSERDVSSSATADDGVFILR